MEDWQNDTEKERPKYLKKNPVPLLIRPPKFPYGIVWDRRCVSAFTSCD